MATSAESLGIRIGSKSIVGTTDVGSVDNRPGAREGLESATGVGADPRTDPEVTSVAGAEAAGAEPEGPSTEPLGPEGAVSGLARSEMRRMTS
ncbi:hypothetical protein NDU88_004992 [Pleurodeles waltl]|uniref:Uncharacterized protein n=1 Tax=Pleurodeles waltl TaxID=8319 RepID=A0AAV7TA24_PLEWA|nr:hypothetical protein NDU88_004992 [Pleurodeles waltl]